MKGLLYIPYINTEYDENSFNYRGNDFDYIDKLNDVGHNIIGANNYYDQINHNSHISTIGFNSQNNNNNIENILSYYELPCLFMNVDEVDLTLNELKNYENLGEGFIFIFKFDYDNVDEDTLIELKGWITESIKVNNLDEDLYDEDTKIELLPKRQFKIKLDKNEAYLNECIFIETNDGSVAIFVNKIKFIN